MTNEAKEKVLPPVHSVAEDSVEIARAGVLNVKNKLNMFLTGLDSDIEKLYEISDELEAILDELSV